MIISYSWPAIENRLRAISERLAEARQPDQRDTLLESLGLIDSKGLTTAGENYYMALFVLNDPAARGNILNELLKSNVTTNTFCSTLWPHSPIPKTGAIRLLKRLTNSPDEESAKRWLELMNRAGLIRYNRNSPEVTILYNPDEVLLPEEAANRERARGHLIKPETPFSNLLALKKLIRSSRTFICWYEQHLPGKVLETLIGEVDARNVNEIRLLSGPSNIDAKVRQEFVRFRNEMATERRVTSSWRVLPKEKAFLLHDRVFITDGMVRNLPPLNSILLGSVGEILPSNIQLDSFELWWQDGVPIEAFQEAKKAS